jgi:hypothetical protein
MVTSNIKKERDIKSKKQMKILEDKQERKKLNYVEQLKLEEYRFLLKEHKKIRTHLFERPLIILGMVAIAMQYAYKLKIGQFVVAGLIFILCYNLWFIRDRLQSDARIVAYIQLVHEGELSSRWIGWESGLREYRIWSEKHNRQGDIESLRALKTEKKAIPSRIMFYPGIWLLHLIWVTLTFIIAVITLTRSFPLSIGKIGGPLAIFLATATFIYYAFWELHPDQMRKMIELERATWRCVFEEIASYTPRGPSARGA